MPISRGPGLTTLDVPAGRSLPQEFQPAEYLIWWTTPPDRSGDTETILLTPPGLDFFTLRQIAGLGVTPRDITTSPNPDGGLIVDQVLHGGRQIVLPIRTRNRDHLDFLAVWRHVGAAFAATSRGPGTLRIDRPDGTSRQIQAYYQSGWEGDPGDGAWLEDTCSVSLLCPDPWWRDTQPVTVIRQTETLVDYLDPYPNIGSGQVLGATEIHNPGEVDAWPTWTVTGPMTSLTATNTTRNQAFVLTYDLDDGETITVSSRPIQVRGPANENLISALNLPTGKPWRLDAGTVSAVTFTMAGADAGSKVELSFTPGYETA